MSQGGEAMGAGARVAIVMGSQSDWPTMRCAAQALDELGVAHDARIVSAHRTPDRMYQFARGPEAEGSRVIIAGAGGAAHLPGMLASLTPLPVIGVPVPLKNLDGLDSLLSIVQMPNGVPVATVAIGAGRNAGLLAARIVGAADEEVRRGVDRLRAEAADKARAADSGLDRA